MKTAIGALLLIIFILAGLVIADQMKLNRQWAEKSELQRTIDTLQAQVSEAQTQSQHNQQIASAQMQAARQSETIETISGIYYGKANGYNESKIDLRSDGTAIYHRYYSPNDRGQKVTWTLSSKTVSLSNGTEFTVESSDLIDAKGNRWLHVRQ